MAADFGGHPYGGSLAAGFVLARSSNARWDLGLDLSAGIAGVATDKPLIGNNNSGGYASMAQPTAELAVLAGFLWDQSKLCAGPSLTTDLLWLHAYYPGGREQKMTALAVAAGIKISYQYNWARSIFIRGDASADLELRGVDIYLKDPNEAYHASTRIWATLGLGVGVRF
ncbi:MAG: hypothetical protein ABSB49_15460 [Polyangia bacterium]